MNRKRFILILCVATIIICALAYAHAHIQNNGRARARAAFREQDVYEHLFRHHVHLRRRAEEEERNGRDGRELRSRYRREARLTEREASLLDEIASDSVNRVDELSARARQLIAEARARVPGGRLQRGQTPPPPPSELSSLQRQREDIVLRARGRLRREFGAQAFTRFDEFVQRNVADNMQPVAPLEHPHRPRARGSQRPDATSGGGGLNR